MLIYNAALKTPYRILGINLPKDSLLHLSNLGLAAGETIEVVTKTKNSAIIRKTVQGLFAPVLPMAIHSTILKFLQFRLM